MPSKRIINIKCIKILIRDLRAYKKGTNRYVNNRLKY